LASSSRRAVRARPRERHNGRALIGPHEPRAWMPLGMADGASRQIVNASGLARPVEEFDHQLARAPSRRRLQPLRVHNGILWRVRRRCVASRFAVHATWHAPEWQLSKAPHLLRTVRRSVG
jgi:hypothetical protein